MPFSTISLCYLFFILGISSIRAQHLLPRVLIYSATAAYRHDSIPTAIQALKDNGASINATFDNTEDRAYFDDANLMKYDAIVFLSTTGEVLDTPGIAALQNYLTAGGNFVGIHSASDSLRKITFFVQELGARFDYHPDLQEAIVDVIGPTHPSTTELPQAWSITEEIYNFESDPRDLGAVVVLAANESSYIDTGIRKFDQGTPHPLAWYQEHGAGVSDNGRPGRSFYTSLGHLNETWQDPTFLSHVFGGISWVLQSNLTRAYNSSGSVGNADPLETQGPSATSSKPSSSTSKTSTPSATSSSSRAESVNVFGALFLVAIIILV